MFTVDGKATQLVRSLAKVPLSNLSELRIGLLGNAAVAALASCNLPALDHLAIGGGGYNVKLTEKGVGALAASPLGKQLRTLELGRCEISPAMAEQVLKLKKLERFSAIASRSRPSSSK